MKRPAIATMTIALMFLLILLSACDQANQTTDSATQPTAEDTLTTAQEDDADPAEVTMTLDELAGFDGKDGRPAYVAVDGVIYDVSASTSWPEGTHTPCNLDAMAGQDLSETLTRAPASMRSLLESMPVVGRLE